MTFSCFHSSDSGGRGSFENTSRPAPAIHFSFRASTRADSSMISPRATLPNIAVGLHARSSRSPIHPRVVGVSGAAIKIKSDWASNSPTDSARTRHRAAYLPGRRRQVRCTRCLAARQISIAPARAYQNRTCNPPVSRPILTIPKYAKRLVAHFVPKNVRQRSRTHSPRC